MADGGYIKVVSAWGGLGKGNKVSGSKCYGESSNQMPSWRDDGEMRTQELSKEEKTVRFACCEGDAAEMGTAVARP